MRGGTPKFAFEAQLWNATVQRTFNLKKVFRQTDQGSPLFYPSVLPMNGMSFTEFIDMLNEMRFGRLSPASIAKFKSLKDEKVYDDGIGPTELYV